MEETYQGLNHNLPDWGIRIFHATTVPQLLLDFNGGEILLANEASARFFERPVEELQAKCLPKLFMGGDFWTPDLRQRIAESQFTAHYLQYQTPSGQVREAEAHLTLIPLGDQQVVHACLIDLSEQIRLLSELERTHNRYRTFFDISEGGICFARFSNPIPTDLPVEEQIRLQFERAVLEECNLAFCRAFGYESPSQLIGRPLTDFFAPEVESHLELVRAWINSGYNLRSYLLSCLAPTGTIVHYLYNVVGWVVDGQLLGVWGAFNDVTELVRAQLCLSEREAIYREFVALSHQGIGRIEASVPIPINLPIETQQRLIEQGAILAECSPDFARMLGYESPDQIVGKSYGEVVWIDNVLNQGLLRAFIENGYRIVAREMVSRTPTGEVCYGLVSAWGVVRDGFLIRGWVIAQDITELKRLQEQLAQAYRFESLGRIAGGIAHDFNNILTAVVGYTELLANHLQDHPELTRYTEGILKASQRASDLTRQLLAYARKLVIQKKPIHFREVLDEMDTILNRLLGSSVILRVDVAPDLWLVLADTVQLSQVILNLATNARDAMPEGGTLTIRVSNHIQEVALKQGLEPGEYVKLEVSDTGSGIPGDVLSRIFEPFYTTKPHGMGTGMGLAAVEGIVKQLGGVIEVESELNRGTTFRIYFPRYIPPDSPKESATSRSA